MRYVRFDFKLSDIVKVRRKTRAVASSIDIASAKALTFTAERAQKRVTQFIPQVFDNPTPFTRRSVRKTTATISRLSADVFFKDLTASRPHYLAPQVYGGARPQKPFEKRLGGYWVPGRDAKRNRYGNLTAGTWSKILADLQMYGARLGDPENTLTKAQGGKKKIRFFMRRHRNGKRIIFKKVGKRTIPWLVEVSPPTYKKRLPFFKIVGVVMRQQYPVLYDRALQREVARRS